MTAQRAGTYRRTIAAGAAALVFLIALYYILSRFTFCENCLLPMCLAALGAAAAVLGTLLRPDTAGRRFLRRAGFIAAGVIFLELTAFQLHSFASAPQICTVPLTESVQEPDKRAAAFDGETLVITGNTNVKIPFEAENIRWLSMQLDAEAGFYEIACSMEDENFSSSSIRTSKARLNGSQKSVLLELRPHGRLHSFSLHFMSMSEGETVRITGIALRNARPYEISWLRLLLLAGLLLLCTAVQCFGWHRIEYDSSSLVHREAVTMLFIVCAFAAGAFCGGGILRPYEPDSDLTVQDPYYQTFDAWHKGQLHLDLPVDEALLALDNPYDHSARTDAGVTCAWDRAFYEGKYYSYFGIAPVLFVYEPVYVLTGRLPSMAAAVCLFAVMALACQFLLILTLVKHHCPQVKLLTLLLGLAAAAVSSGVYLCMNYADFYYAALAAGMAFLYLSLWLGLLAIHAKTQRSRLLLLAGCGLSVVCIVLSRPNMALYILLLVPGFLSLLREASRPVRERLSLLPAFFVPVMLGAAGVMAYNAARFASPLDFGTAYQLTVSDTSANTLRLSAIPEMLIAYFFHPLRPEPQFPFFSMDTPSLGDTGQYIYAAPGFGVLLYPIAAAAFVLAVRQCRRETRGTALICMGAAALTFAVAWLDYCMGGYNLRYQCDILPVLAVLGTVLLLREHKDSRWPSCCFAAGIAFSSLTLPALGMDWAFWYLSPALFFDLQRLFII